MKFAPALCALALPALLAACASRPDQVPSAPETPPASTPAPVATPAPVTTPPPADTPAPVAAKTYRPGMGIIESATVVALPSSSSAAEGGASGPTMAYRLKMLDGSLQSVVQVGPRFKIGDRVEVTPEGRVVHP